MQSYELVADLPDYSQYSFAEQVIEFIKRRFPDELVWLHGNCFWFATILCTRFQQLQIYYLPIMGHFVSGYGADWFDASGKITLTQEPIKLSDIQQEDPAWFKRLTRDCIL